MITTINEFKHILETSEQWRKDYLKWKRKNVSFRGIAGELGSENNAGARFGNGLYSAALSNKAMAKGYGTVYYVVNGRPKNPKRFNTVTDWETWFGNTMVFNYSKSRGKDYLDKRDFYDSTNIVAEMGKLGFDGVEIIGREYVNYKPEDVMYFENDYQLENYYDRKFGNKTEHYYQRRYGNNVNESLEHDKYLYRNTSQQWLINLLKNGNIKTKNKKWISLSQDKNSGSQDNYGNCHIVFDEHKLYNQGAIEVDYEDISFFIQYPTICNHITGFKTEKEYYDNLGYANADEANQNSELTWEQHIESYANEEEVVIPEIIYEKNLIISINIINEHILPELIQLLNKYKIKYT